MNDFNSQCSPRRSDTISDVLHAVEKRSGTEENWGEIAAKARGLMAGYNARWANDGWHAAAVETTFHLPIINPASGRRSRTFTRAGRYGGIVERDGERLLLVLRTAAEPIEESGSLFWQRSAVDWQSCNWLPKTIPLSSKT